jgi:hypothetical protein
MEAADFVVLCKEVSAAYSRPSGSLVDVAPVANVMEVDASLLHIEFVKHSVIADP